MTMLAIGRQARFAKTRSSSGFDPESWSSRKLVSHNGRRLAAARRRTRPLNSARSPAGNSSRRRFLREAAKSRWRNCSRANGANRVSGPQLVWINRSRYRSDRDSCSFIRIPLSGQRAPSAGPLLLATGVILRPCSCGQEDGPLPRRNIHRRNGRPRRSDSHREAPPGPR